MLIPIGHDEQKVTRLPWLTIALVVANLAVFLLTRPLVGREAADIGQRVQEVERYAVEHPYLRLPAGLQRSVPAHRPPASLSAETLAEEQAHLDRLVSDLDSVAADSVYQTYGFVPKEPRLISVFTSMFLHGGWVHLLGNILFLWLAGASLEDRWGRAFFPILYLASGITATLTHAAMHPHSLIPMVGASGAIAGLMGAFLVRLAATRIRFFYWISLFHYNTFSVRAYVVLPLWLLQQLAMARSETAGGVAVWAHIGGFVFGAAVAALVRLTDFEARVLAPSIAKKTTWTASDRLATALERLDRGEADGAIQELKELLKALPESVEARTTLITAYTRKEDRASAGRESARLVGVYLRARDMDGGLAAAAEHKQAYPDIPLAMRDMLALAAHREKLQQHREAAALYRGAIAAWPEDALTPKALVSLGRLQSQVFQEHEEALELLARARTHSKVPPEFQKVCQEMIAGIQRDRRREGRPAPDPTAPIPSEATTRAAPTDMADLQEPERASIPPPTRKLVPIPMRVVRMDTRGMHLQDRGGKPGHLAWNQVTGVSVAAIGGPTAPGTAPSRLILDLHLARTAPTADGVIRCIRLSIQDLAIPQLRGEPSPLRGFQRFVATVLKTTGGPAHPGRRACLGLSGFPAFPDLPAYEADLLARLPSRD